ncbi:hypothetical protein GCM10027217_38210 [Pseudomaricurvus hydrocarbonicus]
MSADTGLASKELAQVATDAEFSRDELNGLFICWLGCSDLAGVTGFERGSGFNVIGVQLAPQFKPAVDTVHLGKAFLL